jgi:hypothetical protein
MSNNVSDAGDEFQSEADRWRLRWLEALLRSHGYVKDCRG